MNILPIILFVASAFGDPIKPVVVDKVDTRAFRMVNGATVDLSLYLDAMLKTALSNHGSLRPLLEGEAPSSRESCLPTLRLVSAVTALELGLKEFQFTIGYNSNGPMVPPITNATGSVNVKKGLVAMDFALFRCSAEGCLQLLGSTVTHSTANLKLDFKFQLDLITGGGAFLYQTSMAKVFEAIMKKGVENFHKDPVKTSRLPWQSELVAHDPVRKRWVMTAGADLGIQKNEQFIIYAPRSRDSSSCPSYVPVALAHAPEEPGTLATELAIDREYFGGPQLGDIVTLKPQVAPPTRGDAKESERLP